MDDKYLWFSTEIETGRVGYIQLNGNREKIEFDNGYAYDYFGTVITNEDQKVFVNQRLYVTPDFLESNKSIIHEGSIIPIICIGKVSEKGNRYKRLVINLELSNGKYYEDWSVLYPEKSAIILYHKCAYGDVAMEKGKSGYEAPYFNYSNLFCCDGDWIDGVFYPNKQLKINIPVTVISETIDDDSKKSFLLNISSYTTLLKYGFMPRYTGNCNNIAGGNTRTCHACYFTLSKDDFLYDVRLSYLLEPSLDEIKAFYNNKWYPVRDEDINLLITEETKDMYFDYTFKHVPVLKEIDYEYEKRRAIIIKRIHYQYLQNMRERVKASGIIARRK